MGERTSRSRRLVTAGARGAFAGIRRGFVAGLVVPAVLAGCGAAPASVTPSADLGTTASTEASASAQASAAPTASPRADVMSAPAISAAFPVGPDAHKLQLECYGHGTPIVFEAGTDTSGIQAFPDALLRPLAETHLVCLYDRLGTGASDAPTAERRTIDDVVADLDAVLAAAKVSPPYVFVGQSAGGNLAIWYAIRHAKDVRALVLIDVGFDDPDEIAAEFPGALAWAGQEHVDYVDGARLESEIRMPIARFPVLIITADHGEASPPPPSGWGNLTSNTREIVKHGGHDLHQEMPAEIAIEIASFLSQN